MAGSVKPSKRSYHAPRRAAAAAQTREAILQAAKTRFETRGWAGTTIAGVAGAANVSPKTIEALFSTKAALLAAVADYSIRGDTNDVPMGRRDAAQAVEAAPDAATMLERHIEYSTPISARSARIARVVESAAGSDKQIAKLWTQMTHNRRYGAHWAAETLLQKPGARPELTLDDTEQMFIIAMDWATHRTLLDELKLSLDQVKDWTRRYYQRMFLT